MLFSEFSWPEGVKLSIASLPNPKNHFFDLLLREAEERGLHHEGHKVWGCLATIKMKKNRIVTVVVIGNAIDTHTLPGRTVLTINSPILGKSPGIAVWHMVLKLHDNPIELHMKWSPVDGEHMAFLNVHNAKKREQLAAIPALVDAFNFIKAQPGRKKGSIGTAPEDFERMRESYIHYRIEKQYTLDDTADKLGIDVQTLRSYIKLWGINSP